MYLLQKRYQKFFLFFPVYSMGKMLQSSRSTRQTTSVFNEKDATDLQIHKTDYLFVQWERCYRSPDLQDRLPVYSMSKMLQISRSTKQTTCVFNVKGATDLQIYKTDYLCIQWERCYRSPDPQDRLPVYSMGKMLQISRSTRQATCVINEKDARDQ